MKPSNTHRRLAGIVAVAALAAGCTASPPAAPRLACTTLPIASGPAAGTSGQGSGWDLPPVRGGLGGVAARSSGSALAVGWTFGATGSHQRTLVALWNGAVWRTLSSRALPRESALGAAALFPGGAWAVGEKDMAENGRVFFPLMVRVTGTTVRQVPVPRTTYGGSLSDVAATSAADAWAVGFEATIGGGGGPGLILHWNGTGWTRALSPKTHRAFSDRFLAGVSASSADNAWAVGGSDTGTLALHWN